jgi:prepilin-type N-terminal cleavage/methylation domain-containing protein
MKRRSLIHPDSKRGFTLIELLVVIAIIAILAAILFPVFAQAKRAAKTSSTLSNVKQLGTSVHMYLADSDDQTPSAFQCVNGTDANGWCTTNWWSNDDTLFVTWYTLTHPYTKNGEITMDTTNRARVATTAPGPTSGNWSRFTTISANRLGFFEADRYEGSVYVTQKSRNVSGQENLSSRAMFTVGRRSDTNSFGQFFFDQWLACDPNYTAPDFWKNIVWLGSKDHAAFIPTVRGDSSAKTIPWNRVRKNPADPWWVWDYAYWGRVQSATE